MPAWSIGRAARGIYFKVTVQESPLLECRTEPQDQGHTCQMDQITSLSRSGGNFVILTVKSMGKSNRSNLYATKNNPGPGSYDVGARIGGPKYVIAGRHSQSVANLSPGPGQYNPDFKAKQAATAFKYTMGGRPSSAQPGRSGGAPGPGSYNLGLAKEKCGGRFGKDSRKPLNSSSTHAVPGPGAYDSRPATATLLAAPRYT